MEVKIKKLNDKAVIPFKAHPTDAGFDLVATSKAYDKHGCVWYGTGIAVEIPKGYVGFIFPRSSISKYDISLCNSVGTIDSGYRGELLLKFKPQDRFFGTTDKDVDFYSFIDEPTKNMFVDYNVGDKIGQLIILPYPEIEFNEVGELSDSDRGGDGFGSSGN